MKNLISPSQKDAILSVCIENSGTSREAELVYTDFEDIVSYEQVEEVLLQFQRLGFVEIFQLGPGDI